MRWVRDFLLQLLILLAIAALSMPYNLCAQSFTPDSLIKKEAAENQRQSSKKKSPTGAVLRSLAFPGWGQFYNGQKIKAALVFGAEAAIIGTAIYWNQQLKKAKEVMDEDLIFIYRDNRNLAYWFLAGTIVLSMLDAYVDAQLSDFDEDPSLALIEMNQRIGGPSRLLIGVKLRL